MIKKAKIIRLASPIQGYRYSVQLLTSVDGGKTFYYCGNGRYFRELRQAVQYKREVLL